MTTKEIIDRIFKEPGISYELTEFESLGKPIHEILEIYPKTATSGRDAGKTKYFLKSLIPFSSGNEEVQVYVEGGKSAPEEIVRQLWVYKLIHHYGYKPDEIDLEKSVQFGTDIGTKAADIIVYENATKTTPKIIVECKKPKRKDGIEQLKSYMNAKGAPVAIWSNGSDSIILYRPYPAQFDDTLFDLPKRGQKPKDVLEAKKTLLQLKKDFNFKRILQDLEELVLADSGKDEFNEIFKLIFAKIWDEKEALENRKDKVVEFRKAIDPDITFDRINTLFHRACEEWPGIFRENEDIELAKRHLQVCVGPIEGVRLMGSNLRIMDDAFEYLLPTEAKKKKGQFFTPRHVVEMCVRMLNPRRNEFVMDPSCGSGGFLLHAMDWCYPAATTEAREARKHKYAAKYLWGIDFEQRAAKTSRALMLIAGDGHTNIFGPDVSSLDPKTWYETASGQALMHGLRQARLTAVRIPEQEALRDPEPEPEPVELPEPVEEEDAGTRDRSEDALAAAEEKVERLRAEILDAKQRAFDLESDIEAVKEKFDTESSVTREELGDDKPALREQLKRIKITYAEELAKAKAAKKERSKSVRQEIKRLEKELPAAEYELKLLTNRGRLELILDDPDQIAALKDHWISAEVSKRLDYPIFMAVSERGGKNNSGDYEYRLDEYGGLLLFDEGHPQAGQPVIDQDLVNYDLTPDDLADAAAIPDNQLSIAEAFIRFAQDQEFNFWRDE